MFSFSLFYLYLFIVLLFLCPLFYFVTLELYQIVKFFLYFTLKYKFISKTLLILHHSQYIEIINTSIRKKDWFTCICMLEFYLLHELLNVNIIYKYLAYCYKELLYFDLAEYYYLKILQNYPDQLNILYYLKELYNLSGDKVKSCQIAERIKIII
uniref:Uncharacterized protein n=1 Tax=Taenioma perpusillum TaxID=210852 RepID=A0A1Z1MQR0_9FLOR|nr:hypothetical protein [Taenioma perpusillum]ARW68408.1 hypothetical protein [Taenioma perpusillum]